MLLLESLLSHSGVSFREWRSMDGNRTFLNASDQDTEQLLGYVFFFFQAEDGIGDLTVTGVQTCALPILLSAGGEPGSEPAIRLRGGTQLTSPSACTAEPCASTFVAGPLVIVDGTINRHGLADINSEDIERVEVVKGAAASSLYGSNAADGVVQIFTKRGE